MHTKFATYIFINIKQTNKIHDLCTNEKEINNICTNEKEINNICTNEKEINNIKLIEIGQLVTKLFNKSIGGGMVFLHVNCFLKSC